MLERRIDLLRPCIYATWYLCLGGVFCVIRCVIKLCDNIIIGLNPSRKYPLTLNPHEMVGKDDHVKQLARYDKTSGKTLKVNNGRFQQLSRYIMKESGDQSSVGITTRVKELKELLEDVAQGEINRFDNSY